MAGKGAGRVQENGCLPGLLRHGGLCRRLHGVPGRGARMPQHLGAVFEHLGRGGGERTLLGEASPWQAVRGSLGLGEDVAGLVN